MMSRAFVAACVLAGLCAGAPAASAAGTRVVVTVDVESNSMYRLIDQIDAVCSDGSPCGLMEIARLLHERQWAGTFFLNVYEQRQWGDGPMRQIVARLQRDGQDLGLHTHPDSAYDSSRPEMYQYSLDEQTAIVRDGVRLLRDWTGLPVLTHRAGAYSADERTLTALERNGIVVDSSLFWQYPKSRLNGTGLPSNLPAVRGRVTEVPVTAYERQDRPAILGSLFAPVSSVRKIDADWLINSHEMQTAIDDAVAADFPVIVVFLHSFSFMDEPSGGGAPAADRHAMEMFRATLDYIASRHLPVVSMRDLAAGGVPLAPATRDVVPRVVVSVDLPHYVWRRMKASDAFAFTFGITVILLGGGTTLALVRRVKRSNVSTAPASATADGVGTR